MRPSVHLMCDDRSTAMAEFINPHEFSTQFSPLVTESDGFNSAARLVMGEFQPGQAKTYKSRSKVHQNCLKIRTKFKIQAQKPLFSNR